MSALLNVASEVLKVSDLRVELAGQVDVLAEIQAGNLKARQIGSQWRIGQAALDEFLRG